MTTACGTHDPAGSVAVRDSTEEAAAHSLWVVLFGPAHGQSGTARGLSSCGWGAFSLPARPQRVSMSRMRRSRLFTSRAVIRVRGPTLDYGVLVVRLCSLVINNFVLFCFCFVVNGTVPQTWCGPARVRPSIGPRRTRAAVNNNNNISIFAVLKGTCKFYLSLTVEQP